MADNNFGDEEQDVDDLGWDDEDSISEADDATEEVAEAAIEVPVVYASSEVSARVMETVNSAKDGWTVTVRTNDDFLAVCELLEEDNPKGLKACHDPKMGHHSMATG